MRFVIGLLAFIGFAVVMVFLAAIGLFAYDELRRKFLGEDFETPAPAPPGERSSGESAAASRGSDS